MVAVNPVTNRIYVAATGGSEMTVIDGATLATTPVTFDSTITALAVNPATNRIYVLRGAPYPNDALSQVDGTTLAATTILVANIGKALAVNSIANKIYVGSGGTPASTASPPWSTARRSPRPRYTTAAIIAAWSW